MSGPYRTAADMEGGGCGCGGGTLLEYTADGITRARCGWSRTHAPDYVKLTAKLKEHRAGRTHVRETFERLIDTADITSVDYVRGMADELGFELETLHTWLRERT